MSFNGTYQITVQANGVTCLGITSKTAELGIEPLDATLPVGNAGTLTRSDTDTGIVTLTAGHTITTLDIVDVYWDGGIRYGMEATTNGTSGNSFQVDGGAGDSLPATAETPIVIATQVPYSVTFDGDDAQLLGLSATQRSLVIFYNASTVLLAQEIVAAGGWGWAADLGITNPLTGDPVTSVTISNGSSVLTSNVKFCGLRG
jgi:hypothetical protein